jgi:hypothetical protein
MKSSGVFLLDRVVGGARRFEFDPQDAVLGLWFGGDAAEKSASVAAGEGCFAWRVRFVVVGEHLVVRFLGGRVARFDRRRPGIG